MKEEVLKRFGLTDKETRTFLATLEIGQATVNEIAKRSGIFRTYCYDILGSLSEQGLVGHVIRSGVKYYETVEPGKLIDILKEREDDVRSILPELRAMRGGASERPGVEFYEGKEGIKTIHADILKSAPREVLVYGNTGRHGEVMRWHFPRYVSQRVRRRITTRVITERTPLTEGLLRRREKEELRSMRFFPVGFAVPVLKYIYGRKVAMIALGKDVLGVVVDDDEIARGEKAAFELMWLAAEK